MTCTLNFNKLSEFNFLKYLKLTKIFIQMKYLYRFQISVFLIKLNYIWFRMGCNIINRCIDNGLGTEKGSSSGLT